jgi:hypothetical protein
MKRGLAYGYQQASCQPFQMHPRSVQDEIRQRQARIHQGLCVFTEFSAHKSRGRMYRPIHSPESIHTWYISGQRTNEIQRSFSPDIINHDRTCICNKYTQRKFRENRVLAFGNHVSIVEIVLRISLKWLAIKKQVHTNLRNSMRDTGRTWWPPSKCLLHESSDIGQVWSIFKIGYTIPTNNTVNFRLSFM